ncbi:phenylalanine--tRNA ligase subunit beta, partial [Klebsiella pneumoniae]
IVVGQVKEFTPEPQSNGKTIRWCQVDVGEENGGVRGIVCGAGNFFEGDKVVVTLPGAVLPGPFPIAARKTYGHVSDGMIASARELGLGDEHNGIL